MALMPTLANEPATSQGDCLGGHSRHRANANRHELRVDTAHTVGFRHRIGFAMFLLNLTIRRQFIGPPDDSLDA